MKSNKEFLRHILDECDFIINQTDKMTQDEFDINEVEQRAFVRSLEIIGEATKKVDENFKKQHPDIEWRAMAGTRDKLIHDYIGVDYDLVWDIAKTKIPKLKNQIKNILSA